MLVVEAQHMGMCFGVRDALEYMRALPNPDRVTIHGELVHNPVITHELEGRGFRQESESSRGLDAGTPDVLITAHGVSHTRRDQLKKAGYQIHDTTCPLVRRAHKAALHYHAQGYFVIVIGKQGHVEVEGLVGDLQRFQAISKLEEIVTLPHQRIAVVNQTTTRPDELQRFHQRIRNLNPERELLFVDTTCRPTKDRQKALRELLPRVQGLVVVGGPNSNNTRQLGLLAGEFGLPWWHVSRAEELQEDWFRGIRIVGLSAGTSTADETIFQVRQTLRSFAREKLTA